jgi:hypothetical protein
MFMCYICVISIHREYPDIILGDKPLLFQGGFYHITGLTGIDKFKLNFHQEAI